jgi:hypothetical protein
MDEFNFGGVGFVDAGLADRLTSATTGAPDASRSPWDYMAGALQTGLALGTTYVSRRMDIDLQQRLAGSMPAGSAVRRTDQPLVTDHADLTTRTVAKAATVRIGDVVPWVAAAGLAWFFLRKG